MSECSKWQTYTDLTSTGNMRTAESLNSGLKEENILGTKNIRGI